LALFAPGTDLLVYDNHPVLSFRDGIHRAEIGTGGVLTL